MVNRSLRRVCRSRTSKPKPFTCTLLRGVDLRDRRRYFRMRCGICWSSRGTKNTRLCSRCGHPFACYARSWNETPEYGFPGSGSQGPPQSLVGFVSLSLLRLETPKFTLSLSRGSRIVQRRRAGSPWDTWGSSRDSPGPGTRTDRGSPSGAGISEEGCEGTREAEQSPEDPRQVQVPPGQVHSREPGTYHTF